MKLSKYRDGSKYVLKFEITPLEALVAGISFESLWESQSIAEFVTALSKMTKQPTANESFAEKLRQARATFTGTTSAQGFGAFGNREQMDEYLRQQQAASQFTRTPPEPEWAKTLGVKSTATRDEIKSRYRKLAMEHHPDKGGDPAKFAKISAAYDEAMAVK